MMGFIGSGKRRWIRLFRMPCGSAVAVGIQTWRPPRSDRETVKGLPHQAQNVAPEISYWPLCYRKYISKRLKPKFRDIRRLPRDPSTPSRQWKDLAQISTPQVSNCSRLY